MRNALLTAALVGLLAVIVDPMRSAAAQFSQSQPVAPQFWTPQRRTPAPQDQTLAPQGRTAAREKRARAPHGRTVASERRDVVPERSTRARERRGEARKARTAASQEPRGKTRKTHRARPAPSPNEQKVAEGNGFKPLSELVNFPKFFPGLGILYVKPDTMPLGPYLCFDREGRLVATLYMVPITDIDDHKTMDAAGFPGARVDHVSFYFNPGHPGMEMPHYHVVIWHVTKEQEARVAK